MEGKLTDGKPQQMLSREGKRETTGDLEYFSPPYEIIASPPPQEGLTKYFSFTLIFVSPADALASTGKHLIEHPIVG